MTKLIIQIPCYNEQASLAATVVDIPRHIHGVDLVELLVVDDGSTDSTTHVAREVGVEYLVRHNRNRGLAAAFRSGMDACLRLGADIIVNTDGDNQYLGQDIPKLVAPILRGEADIVVGDRRTWTVAHFSFLKKCLQWLGSVVVRQLSGTSVRDAASGFRAFHRDAAIRLDLVDTYSHCMETIVQAGRKQLRVTSVPIRTNGPTRKSRLIRGTLDYLWRSVITIVRTFLMYYSIRVFCAAGFLLGIFGLVPMIRFFYLFLAGQGTGHVQSLILGGVLLLAGFMTFVMGLLADLIAYNRQLLEAALERLKRVEYSCEAVTAALPHESGIPETVP